jgi:hypothetical protein
VRPKSDGVSADADSYDLAHMFMNHEQKLLAEQIIDKLFIYNRMTPSGSCIARSRVRHLNGRCCRAKNSQRRLRVLPQDATGILKDRFWCEIYIANILAVTLYNWL